MTDTFDKLKQMLAQQGTLSEADVENMVAAHGALTDDERVWLAAEQFRLQRASGETVTMEQYLAASRILDSAPEGSAEYNEALKIVEAFESGS
jgi:hypothetical protein